MKQNKQIVISIIAISIAVIALIVNVIILLTKQNEKTENEIIIEENVVNVLNGNEIIENNNLTEDFQNITTAETNSEVMSMDEVNNEKSNEEKAIEIVKNDWGGEENTVFRCENNKDADGRYVIEVRDKETLNAKCYYHVNIETGKFEISE